MFYQSKQTCTCGAKHRLGALPVHQACTRLRPSAFLWVASGAFGPLFWTLKCLSRIKSGAAGLSWCESIWPLSPFPSWLCAFRARASTGGLWTLPEAGHPACLPTGSFIAAVIYTIIHFQLDWIFSSSPSCHRLSNQTPETTYFVLSLATEEQGAYLETFNLSPRSVLSSQLLTMFCGQ